MKIFFLIPYTTDVSTSVEAASIIIHKTMFVLSPVPGLTACGGVVVGDSVGPGVTIGGVVVSGGCVVGG